MKQEEKIKAVKLIKEWQEKRPNFSRNKLSQATGLAYATLVEFDKQGRASKRYKTVVFGSM